MSFVAVLPSIYELWTQRCLMTMDKEFFEGTLVVDNRVDNRGVSRSWNIGVDQLLDGCAQWLIVVSAATRFGPKGGRDFLDVLDEADTLVVEAGHGVGWHLIAFPRFVIEKVGRFDENFFAYYEDNDYARRISLAFGLNPLYSSYESGAWCTAEPAWTKTVDLDVSIAGFSHAIDRAGVRPDNDVLRAYYAAKWGALPGGHEGYDHPFNDHEHGVDWWPTPPDARSTMVA